jgi:hypothetical protein
MQHCGGMNYKLTDAARASRRSRAGIRMIAKMKEIHPQGLSNYSVQEDAEPETEADDSERIH